MRPSYEGAPESTLEMATRPDSSAAPSELGRFLSVPGVPLRFTSGAGIFLANGGSITNQAGATIQGTGQYSWGINSFSSVPVSIDNAGTISGNVNGINVDGDSTITNKAGGLLTSSLKSAIAVTNGSHSVITNSGTISSTATDCSPAIALLFWGYGSKQCQWRDYRQRWDGNLCRFPTK
jgi:hypothetical protein